MHKRIIVAAVTIFVMVETKHTSSTYHGSLENYTSHPYEEVEHHEPAEYKYSYAVEDHKTGDYKTHQEERDGDVVKGEYTVAQPDGKLRTVKYTVDKHSGFQAVVTYSGGDHNTEERKEEIHYREAPHHYVKHETETPKHYETTKHYKDDSHSKYHIELPHHFKRSSKEVEVPQFQKKVLVKQYKPSHYEAEAQETKPIYKYVNSLQIYHTTEDSRYFQ